MYRVNGDITAPNVHCDIFHVVQSSAFQPILFKWHPDFHVSILLIGDTIQQALQPEYHIADIGQAITVKLRNRGAKSQPPWVEIWGYEWAREHVVHIPRTASELMNIRWQCVKCNSTPIGSHCMKCGAMRPDLFEVLTMNPKDALR